MKEAQETINEKIVPMIEAILDKKKKVVVGQNEATLPLEDAWDWCCSFCGRYYRWWLENECTRCPLFKPTRTKCYESAWYEAIEKKLSKPDPDVIGDLLGIKMELEAL